MVQEVDIGKILPTLRPAQHNAALSLIKQSSSVLCSKAWSLVLLLSFAVACLGVMDLAPKWGPSIQGSILGIWLGQALRGLGW